MSAYALAPMLDPRPLGADWSCYTGASAFCVLWRGWRINQLARKDVRAVLGISLRSGDDLFRRSITSEALHEGLARAFVPAADESARTHWRLEAWWPFAGTMPLDHIPWRLRICVGCARSCYHTHLFQMPGVHTCPWHRTALIDACPRCERPLLCGFKDGLAPGQCPCGHDVVNALATLEGEDVTRLAKARYIESYHCEALEHRRSHWLIAPDKFDAHAWDALNALIERPDVPLAGRGPLRANVNGRAVLLDHVRMEPTLAMTRTSLHAVSGLDTVRSGIASLPLAWHAPLQSIGEQLLEMLPPDALRELGQNPDMRHAISRLPAFPCGNRLFLQTDCLDRTVLWVLGQLMNATRPPHARQLPKLEALSEWLKGQSLATQLVERVVLRLLTRGYADGARVALGRQVPSLYATRRHRPVVRLPWIVLAKAARHRLPSATVAWTRQDGTG